MTRPFAAAIVIALGLRGATPLAKSERNAGPLASIDDIAVEVVISESLGVDSNPGTPLFNADENAADVACAKIEKAVTERFGEGGLRVSNRSTNRVNFVLFGGKFAGAGNAGANFFMIQVDVCNSEDGVCTEARTILGVATDSELTARLVKTAVELTAEFSEQRSAWRKSKKR